VQSAIAFVPSQLVMTRNIASLYVRKKSSTGVDTGKFVRWHTTRERGPYFPVILLRRHI